MAVFRQSFDVTVIALVAEVVDTASRRRLESRSVRQSHWDVSSRSIYSPQNRRKAPHQQCATQERYVKVEDYIRSFYTHGQCGEHCYSVPLVSLEFITGDFERIVHDAATGHQNPE